MVRARVCSSAVRVLALAMAVLVAGTGWASAERSERAWWKRKSNAQSEQSTRTNQSGTITNFGGGAGKAATATEIVADRAEQPMISPMSETALLAAISHYESIVASGGWPRVSAAKLKKGKSSDAVGILRKRLVIEGYLPRESLAGERAFVVTEDLEQALRRFQRNHGLAASGRLDKATVAALNVSAGERLQKLRANLPRIQAYAADLGPRYIVVNVPALQLESVAGGTVFSRHNIIAGQPERPTPVVLASVSDLNFNPFWNAPVSIVEKDILPRVRKEGVRVLRDQRIRVFDGYNGPEIDPSQIDWDHVPPDRFFFRQDPGEDNAMASVKINFPSPFGIYLHDTPTKSLFGTAARYLSSGCVRVDRVEILVNWILNGQDGWNPARIEQTAASGERLDVKVINPPQLRVVYLTAWAQGAGPAQFRPDVYDLDGTGFVVGQPLPPGEYSDEGQRFVLKAPPRPVLSAGEVRSARTDVAAEEGFFLSKRRKTKVGSVTAAQRKLVEDEDEPPKTVLKSAYQGSVKKKTVKPEAKKAADKKAKKTQLSGSKDKNAKQKEVAAKTAEPPAATGKKAKPKTEAKAKAAGTEAKAKPVKKKKVEEIAASTANPAGVSPQP